MNLCLSLGDLLVLNIFWDKNLKKLSIALIIIERIQFPYFAVIAVILLMNLCLSLGKLFVLYEFWGKKNIFP